MCFFCAAVLYSLSFLFFYFVNVNKEGVFIRKFLYSRSVNWSEIRSISISEQPSYGGGVLRYLNFNLINGEFEGVCLSVIPGSEEIMDVFDDVKTGRDQII
jgi:hypothetical protein